MLLSSYFHGLLALPQNKLKALQIGSLNNSRGESFFVPSVCLWIPYSVCKFYSAGKPPDLFNSLFQLPSTIKDVTGLKQTSERILFFRVCVWKSRISKKHIACRIASAGHQDVKILAISLVRLATEGRGSRALPLASGWICQHVEDLEQIGQEHSRAVPFTFSLGVPKSHRWAIAASGWLEMWLSPPKSLWNVGNLQDCLLPGFFPFPIKAADKLLNIRPGRLCHLIS